MRSAIRDIPRRTEDGELSSFGEEEARQCECVLHVRGESELEEEAEKNVSVGEMPTDRGNPAIFRPSSTLKTFSRVI